LLHGQPKSDENQRSKKRRKEEQKGGEVQRSKISNEEGAVLLRYI